MKTSPLLLVMAAGLIAGCSQSVEQASKEFNALPPAVQQTVHARVPSGEVADVTQRSRDGRKVYEISFRDAQKHPPLIVAQDGSVVKYEQGTVGGGLAEQGLSRGSSIQADISALPVAVQRAILENAPKADLSEVRRTEQDGRVIYEIEYAGKGRNPRIEVTEDGSVLQSSRGSTSARRDQ